MSFIDIHTLCIATSDPGSALLNHAMFGCLIGSVMVLVVFMAYYSDRAPKHTQSLNQTASLPADDGEMKASIKSSYPPFYIMGGALMADFMGGAFGGSLGAYASSQSLIGSVAGGVLGAIIGIGGIWLMHFVHYRVFAKGYFNPQPNSSRVTRTAVRALTAICVMLFIPTACTVLALGLSIALFQPSLLHFL